MRIVRYLMEHKLALLVVVLMFVIQACCDLALPTFTSDIVDVGVQQGGIEDAVVTEMTAGTYDGICEQLAAGAGEVAGADAQASLELFRASYSASDAQAADAQAAEAPAQPDAATAVEGAAPPAPDVTYALTSYGTEHHDELKAVMEVPLVIVHFGSVGEVSAGELAADANAQDALVSQRAIAAAKVEYELVGKDMWDVQVSYLIRIGLMMLGVTVLAFLVHTIMNFAACRTAAKIGRDLRRRLFTKVVSFSDSEINKFSAASLITRGTNDVTQIQFMSLMAQRMLVYTPIIAIGGIIMVAQTNVGMGWIIALAVAIVCVLVGILFAVTMPKFKIMQKLIDKVNLVSREILTGLPVVRAFGRQPYEEARFTAANTDLLKTQLFTNRAMALMIPGITLVMNGVAVAIVWVGSQYVDLGTVQTGDLIAFITYSMMIISSFLIIGLIAILLPRANVAAQRVDEVIETSTSIQDALEVYDAEVGQGTGVAIAFDDVSFHYAPEDDGKPVDVLRHVSFEVKAGQTCAIIGPTGCGKSTLVKLIERFHDVTQGAVLIDGVDVREISQKRLHELIGYVPQQAFLFSGTVRSNVSYSDESMPIEQVDEALDIAQASDFVAEKEDGLETEISQGGTNVSGGQRQRLAIARALAMPAKAFIFDDSFSALDYKTDAALRLELSRRCAGRTVLIVAQRIATIMNADNIIVLKEGKIAGQGTHEQLLQTCDVYRDIALSQLSEEELAKGGVVL